LLPGFIAALGLGPVTLGAIEGVADGVSAFVKLWSGRLTDRIANRKAVVAAGYYLTGASKALFAFASGWPVLLAGRVIGWFGRGIRGPGKDAMLAESVPVEQAGRAFGFHRAMDTIGAVMGPLVALVTLATIGHGVSSYRTLFLWTLAPGLAAGTAFALWTRDPDPARRMKRPRAKGGSGTLPGAFTPFVIAVGCFGLADFAPTLLMLRATDVLTPALGAAGAATTAIALYVIRNVVYAAGSYPAGLLSDLFPKRRILACGYALFCFVAMGAARPAASVAFFVALFCLSGIVAAVQDTVEGASVATIVPVASRGTAYGALAAVNGMGDLLSSGLVGLLWKVVSPAVAFGATAVLAAAGALLMAASGRRAAAVS
jgi:MFS family permease